MSAVRVLRWVWMAGLALTWGCADGGGTGGTGGGGNGSLQLVQTEPADGASEVDTAVVPRARFGAALSEASVTADSFRVMRDDGVEVQGTLSVTDDRASFTPTQKLALLRGYTATVTTAIESLSGETLETNRSWSFTIRDGAWGDPVLVEINNAGDALAPRVAMGGNGDAFVVWQQSDGTRYNAWANRFTPAAGWGEAVVIESNDAQVFDPDVAVGPDGNAIAVWSQSDGVQDSIWANRFTPAAGWGEAELIEAQTGPAYNPIIAIDPDGNAITVWSQSDGVHESIWANRFTSAAGWGEAVVIESNVAVAARDPEVGVDSNGRAIVVWRQREGARYDVWANRFTPAGGWGAAELIETNDSDSVDYPTVAVDPDGNAITVWRQGYNIWANRFTPAAGWGVAEPLEADDANSPDVAIDSRGHAIAVWGAEGPQYGIWARPFTTGEGWGAAVQINDQDSGASPTIALDPNGNAMVVWLDRDAGLRIDLWSSRFTPTRGWTAAELIETNDTGSVYNDYADVAVDTNGNAIAVWSQTNGTRYDIWTNRFE